MYLHKFLWLGLRHRSSHCLELQYLIWVPVQLLDSPLPIQLPANVRGGAAADSPSAWSPVAMWDIQKKLLAWMSPDMAIVTTGVVN